MKTKFWNAQRRVWAYSIIVATVPLLVALGMITGEIASQVLQIAAAVLAVGGGGLALSHIKPDNVVTLAVDVSGGENEQRKN